MAISINYSAQDFNGRGSGAYPVEFPVSSTNEVWVAVKLAGESLFVTLPREDFEVTDLGGGAFQVTTDDAYAAGDKVKIFRLLDVTQPFEFPEGGSFPSRDVERALDRLLMLIQQIRLEAGLTGAAINMPDGAVSVKGLVIVDNATERGNTAPVYAGQLLVQLSDHTVWEGSGGSWVPLTARVRTAANAAARAGAVPEFLYQPLLQTDTGVLYFSTALTAGSWTEAGAHSVVPGAWPALLTIDVVGDAGEQGTRQTNLAAALTADNPDYVVFCGDNSYGGEAQFHNDWAAFAGFITAQKALPVLGNHDVDGASKYALHTAKFPYLPGNRRYWNKVLGNGLVEIFVLNDGINSAFQDPVASGAEPDGNAVGSAQHTWFVQALNASTARWKLVFFHHPLVSNEQDPNIIAPAMDWPEFARVHAIFNGHVHLSEWLTYRGIPVINASGAVRLVSADANSGTRTDGEAGLVPLQSVRPGNEALIYTNDRDLLFCRLNVSPDSLVVDFVTVNGRRVVYQRQLQDVAAVRPSVWGQEVIGPNDPVFTGMFLVGICPEGIVLNDWFVSVAKAGGAALTGRIWVDGLQVATFSIPAGQYWARIVPPVAGKVRLGGFVQVEILTNSSYPSWQGLALYASGAAVQL